MPTPSFEGSPDAIAARFAEIMARYPDAPVRKTFGSPCAYVNGHMATGLMGASWFVRLDEKAQIELLSVPGSAPFEPMPGRPMRGYIVLAPSLVDDEAALLRWIDRCLAFAAALPPKERKPAKGTRVAKPRR